MSPFVKLTEYHGHSADSGCLFVCRLLSRALLLVRMRERVMNAPITNHSKTMGSKKPHNYIPLLKRMREPSIEERLLRYQHLS